MRILIIGGAGMLGHQLWRHLSCKHEVWVTLRNPVSSHFLHGLSEVDRTITGVDVECPDALPCVFAQVKPEAVVNCVGIIKQLKEANNPLVSLNINSMLPHRLAQICKANGARLLQISTDCVFAGTRGNYTEADSSDAVDLYGRTKFLGEVYEKHCVTIRTSIIGRELNSKHGLIEWFLSQEGKIIQGFRKVIYSGLTTLELARVIERILNCYTDIHGLWQVTSDPINKFQLLQLAKIAFSWRGIILPDDTVICDRSMRSDLFRAKAHYQPPSWEEMIDELAKAPR